MKITEIDRRGFLRGLGAAGAVAATGGALAKAPKENFYKLEVAKGDTIYSLGRKLDVDPKDIYKLNGMNPNTKLEVGQVIKIPEYGKPAPVGSNKHAEPVAQKPVVPGKSIYSDPDDKGIEHSRKAAEPTKSTEIPKSIAVNNPKSALNEPGFMDKLKDIARRLGVEVNSLLGIMGHETIRTFSPSIQAPDGHTDTGQRIPGAVGLIQFTHETAKDLGTSTEELKRMSGTQQLDYVYRFLKKTSRPGMNAGDLYMSIFIPKYVGQDPNTIIGQKGGGKLPGTKLSMNKIWEDNPAFGKNKHKTYFTIQDVKDTLENFMR